MYLISNIFFVYNDYTLKIAKKTSSRQIKPNKIPLSNVKSWDRKWSIQCVYQHYSTWLV